MGIWLVYLGSFLLNEKAQNDGGPPQKLIIVYQAVQKITWEIHFYIPRLQQLCKTGTEKKFMWSQFT